MGQPKQLLDVDGIPLLRRVVEVVIEAKVGDVWVILGANAERVRPTLSGLPIETVVNENWEEGMGGSIRAGMAAIAAKTPGVREVMITLGDQPKISAAHLVQVSRALATGGRSIVASRYGGKLAPPVSFAPAHFPALRNLRGDAGARALLQMNPDQITIIETGDLGDLDTPDDYASLLKRNP